MTHAIILPLNHPADAGVLSSSRSLETPEKMARLLLNQAADTPQMAFDLGVAFLEMGLLDLAEIAFCRARWSSDLTVEACTNLAKLEVHQGNPTLAISWLKEAMNASGVLSLAS